jgi:hypothetical protein
MAWPGERFITKEEHEKIRQTKAEEKKYMRYLFGAIERMKAKPPTKKLKVYKDMD